jgi:hypothetical protein
VGRRQTAVEAPVLEDTWVLVAMAVLVIAVHRFLVPQDLTDNWVAEAVEPVATLIRISAGVLLVAVV